MGSFISVVKSMTVQKIDWLALYRKCYSYGLDGEARENKQDELPITGSMGYYPLLYKGILELGGQTEDTQIKHKL